MSMKHVKLAYGVFLILFAAFKYLSAAPSTFNVGYLVSVVVLVVLTGVLPFVLASFIAGKAEGSVASWVTALGVAVIACCAGYAGYFKLFIEPQNLEVSMWDVAFRGIYAGSIQGILAALYSVARKP